MGLIKNIKKHTSLLKVAMEEKNTIFFNFLLHNIHTFLFDTKPIAYEQKLVEYLTKN